MTSEFRIPPRHVPTLTEVVQFPRLSPESHQAKLKVEELVQQVLHSLQPSLESRLLQGLDTVLLEQLEALESRLREKIQQVLHATVQEEVKRQLELRPKQF